MRYILCTPAKETATIKSFIKFVVFTYHYTILQQLFSNLFNA